MKLLINSTESVWTDVGKVFGVVFGKISFAFSVCHSEHVWLTVLKHLKFPLALIIKP